MGVVQGPDGRFYEIPDEMLAKFAVPDEKVKEVLRGQPEPEEGDYGPPPGMPPGMPMGMPPGGPVVIQIFTSGPPMGAPDDSETVAQDGWGAWRRRAYRPAQQFVWPWGWPGY